MRRTHPRFLEYANLHGDERACGQMLISIDDHALASDLCAHYRRSGFEAESVGGGMVDVRRRDAPTPDQERREIVVHLQIWEVTNPDRRAHVL